MPFAFKNADGTPVDLSGYTLEFRAVNAAGAEVVKRNLTITVPSSGQASITLTPAETRLFTEGLRNKYEIEPRIGGLEQKPWMHGFVMAEGGINSDL